MSKRARDAYPDKYAAAMARKRARLGSGTDVQSTRAIVRSEIKKGSDLKYTDNALNQAAVTSSGTVLSCLQNLVRGDVGLNNFDGNTITPQGLTVKYCFNSNQSFNQVRVMCFQWMDSAVPTLAGIVQNNTTNLGTLSPILITNREYIRVLYDKTHIMAPTAGVPDTTAVLSIWGQATCNGQFFIPAKRMKKIRFNSGTNSVQDGNIYCLLVSDDSAPSYPAISIYTRLSFYD